MPPGLLFFFSGHLLAACEFLGSWYFFLRNTKGTPRLLSFLGKFFSRRRLHFRTRARQRLAKDGDFLTLQVTECREHTRALSLCSRQPRANSSAGSRSSFGIRHVHPLSLLWSIWIFPRQGLLPISWNQVPWFQPVDREVPQTESCLQKPCCRLP